MFFLKDKKIPDESDRLKQVKYNDEPLNQDKLNRAVLNPQPDTTKQTFRDISQQLQTEHPLPVVVRKEPIPSQIYAISLQQSVINFPFECRQIIVYNPTASNMFVSDKGFSLNNSNVPTDYVIKISPSKLFVLPYWPIQSLYYFTTANFNSSTPAYIWAYGEAIFTPTISAI